MEIRDLQSFVVVARLESMHSASEVLHLSPGAVSKAIARLEDELGIQLFRRARQRIYLSEAGRQLQEKANVILALEEEARFFAGSKSPRLTVNLGGEELFLGQYATSVLDKINTFGKKLHCVLEALHDEEIFDRLKTGSLHIGLTSMTRRGFISRPIGKSRYRIVAGRTHPLARAKRMPIPVEELLDFDFVLPDKGLFGALHKSHSNDGWRDDKFPRNIAFRVNSIHALNQLVRSAKGLAYVPDYLIDQIPCVPIDVSGCRYVCDQTTYQTAYKPERIGWLRKLF